MKPLKEIVVVAVCLLYVGCGVTRRLGENEYLLSRMKIETDKDVDRKERIDAKELARYVRQKPNKRLFGTNFYPWVYNLANPEKTNWWNNLKRKIGQEPVVFDLDMTEKSRENLKIYVDSRGYFSSDVTMDIDTVSHRKKAILRYTVRQNAPYFISSFTYECRDRFLEPIIHSDSCNRMVRVGDLFSVKALDDERARVTKFLQNNGYYTFSINNIEYVADTLSHSHAVGVKMIVKRNLVKYDDRGRAVFDNNYVYRLNSITIVPAYNPARAKRHVEYMSRMDTLHGAGFDMLYFGEKPRMKPKHMTSIIPLYQNSIYNADHVNRAYQNIMQSGYFKSARILFSEPVDSMRFSKGFITYMGAQGIKTDSTTLNYTKESYIDCSILCTPSKKQTFKVELEGSTTSSFYGLKLNGGYQNKNIFRGSEMLDVNGTVAYEYMKAPDAKKRNAIELGISTALSFPRLLFFHTSPFGSIVAPKTRIEISYNHQDRPYYRRDITGVNFQYSWHNRRFSSFVIRPISINWVNVGYIDEEYLKTIQSQYLLHSFESQMVCGLTGSYVYNNARLSTTRNQTVFRVNYEFAGNFLYAMSNLFGTRNSEGYYELFGIRYSQYARIDASLSHKIMFGEVTSIAGRIYGGVGVAYGNSTAIPFDRLFYAGGSNSMRGWSPRTLGPGEKYVESSGEYPSQLGDVKLEANLEFRFPIWGIFHGATFLDAGNVWCLENEAGPETVFHFDTFYKQLGFNTGLGLRVDIKVAVLRLDWGLRLYDPNKLEGERWIHNFKWANMALNFGIGYPF